jgi:hypothetical protein
LTIYLTCAIIKFYVRRADWILSFSSLKIESQPATSANATLLLLTPLFAILTDLWSLISDHLSSQVLYHLQLRKNASVTLLESAVAEKGGGGTEYLRELAEAEGHHHQARKSYRPLCAENGVKVILLPELWLRTNREKACPIATNLRIHNA